MKIKNYLWSLIALLIISTLLFSACAPQAPAVEPEEPADAPLVDEPDDDDADVPDEPAGHVPTGTLTVALSTFPNALDPVQTAERNATNAAYQMFDGLLWVNDAGGLDPALAESYEISADGLTYTFHLRQGVTFHNGYPLTAADVVFTYNRGLTGGFEYSYTYERAKTVTAIDDFTVEMTTEAPDPIFLRSMATLAIQSAKFHAEVGEDAFVAHPMGTGPFMFVEWKKGESITMAANPTYWNVGYPKVANLIFRPIPESATRLAAVQTGEVDIVGRLSAEEAATLKNVDGVTLVQYPIDRVFYIAFNNLTSGVGQPTEDARVRIAMNYAVDVDAIIDALFNGFATPAVGLVAPGNLGFDNADPFGYDPEKAKALLAEAGYADGFSIDFACPAGAYTNFEQVCEAIQGYLRDVGIETNLEIMESGMYWDLEGKKELPPLFGDSWSSTLGESIYRLQGALGGWDAGYSAWSDPVIDDYLAKINGEMDTDARAALYVGLQQYMRENPPFIYLYSPNVFEAINNRVHDYRPRPAEDYNLFYTWVAE